MKPMIAILLGAALLNVPVASGQATAQPTRGVGVTRAPAVEPPQLTKFDLDFPGGTPKELLKAVEKGLGKPLNAIVAGGCTDVKLPALKMVNVDSQQLFEALSLASREMLLAPVPGGSGLRYEQRGVKSMYGFSTQGPPSDDAVWYFYYIAER